MVLFAWLWYVAMVVCSRQGLPPLLRAACMLLWLLSCRSRGRSHDGGCHGVAAASFLVRTGVGVGPSVSVLSRHICDGAQWAVATAAAARWVLGWVLLVFSRVASAVSDCLRRRAVCCWFFLWVFLCLGGVFLGDEGDRADSMQRAEATATVTGCMLWGILLAVAFPLSLAALLGHGHGSIRPTAATPTVLVYAVVGGFLFFCVCS